MLPEERCRGSYTPHLLRIASGRAGIEDFAGLWVVYLYKNSPVIKMSGANYVVNPINREAGYMELMEEGVLLLAQQQ